MLILNTAREKLLAGVVIFSLIVALFSVFAGTAGAEEQVWLMNESDCSSAEKEDEGAEAGETILHFVLPHSSDATIPSVTVTNPARSDVLGTFTASKRTGQTWHVYASIPFGTSWDAYASNVTWLDGKAPQFRLSHCDQGGPGQTTTTTTQPTTTTTAPSTTTTTQGTTTTTAPPESTTTTAPPSTTSTTAPPTTTTNPPVTTTIPERYICTDIVDGEYVIEPVNIEDSRYADDASGATPEEAEAKAGNVDECKVAQATTTTTMSITTDTLPFTGEDLPLEASTMLAIAGALLSAGALALFGSRQGIAEVAPTPTQPTWKGWNNHQ